MDILVSCRQMIKEMINLSGTQMKIFLMDKETTSIISCSYAQSEIMQKEVYLFDRLDSKVARDSIGHLKCIVFVRPTAENIALLVSELKRPRYNQYYIYFSNVVNKFDLKSLAEADENEVVREVHEFFMDGIALRKDLNTINLTRIYEQGFSLKQTAAERIKQSIIALLLQLKKNPAIRYQASSSNCSKLADEVSQVIRRENTLFETAQSDVVLLILERSQDVVTPLLNQWTYEAMIHELIGITNNRVNVENQSMVLSELYDDFFTENIISNFGEIGQNIKTLISEFQEQSKINKNLESISDMKKFVEDYPQFKKISGTVTKHVALVGELSKIVQQNNLLEISEVEQSIVADGDHSRCLERIRNLVSNSRTTNLDAVRLVLLYALKFETNPNNEISSLIGSLRLRDSTASRVAANILKYGGQSKRSADLFGGGSTIEITRKFMKGLKGVENIYTQHEPYIKKVVEQFIRGKMDNYPLMGNDSSRQDNLIIYMVGGATYEEAAYVRSMNKKRQQGFGGPSIILSSNCMLNTKSFIDDLSVM
ncbi:unnamed protein product [Caenorhabditis angaria]|uniref:Uncharacterized protein n=1 Tax=Caenorhabditis angaria TaxID=860376 RepID=A0A9P1N9C7_9PELO|nr:unnamed protein product [Caenorhabditis angaria]